MKRIFAALVFALVLGSRLTGEGDAPTLTDQQRLIVQNRVLAVQLAQAQLELVITTLAKPGYTIDLQTIAYVKTEPKAVP